MALAPAQCGEAEIEVAQRDPDRQVADAKVARGQRFSFRLQRVDAGDQFGFPKRLVRLTLQLGWPESSPSRQGGIQHPLSQRVPPQRGQPLGPRGRVQFRAVVQRIRYSMITGKS